MVNQSQFIEETKRWSTRSTIGGLADVNITKAGKKFEAESTIQYIDISSVDNATNTVLGATEYIFKDAPSRAQQCIKAGDILVSTVRPNLKNIAVNHLSGDNLVASSGFCVLRPKDGYTGLLLAYILSDEFTEKMTLVAKGTNYPAVHDSDILDYEITVPEKDEVKRIDSLYRQADKSKFAGFKSQFIEMFGTPSNSIYPIKKLSEVCTFKSGTTFSPDKELSCGDYMYAKVADMNAAGNETYITHTSKYVDGNVAKNTWLPKGTVVFPKRGAAIHTNKKRILIKDTCVDLNTIGVIPGNLIDSLYLYWFFRCLNLSDICEDSGIPQINNKNLVPVDFVVPPMHVQLQFTDVAKQADKSKYLN